MVDLSLASSYIPAFTFYVKSLVVAVLCNFLLPLGGVVAIGIALLLDRVLFNTEFIFDVNTAVCTLFLLCGANYERYQMGCKCSHTALLLSAMWSLASVVTQWKTNIIPWKNELQIYAIIATALSLTMWKPEPLSFLLTRVTFYCLVVALQIYSKLCNKEIEEHFLLILTRHGHIMVGAVPPAIVGALVPLVVAAFSWKQANLIEYDAEAAILRDALASRKEKSSQ
jgi:hypothetical protein